MGERLWDLVRCVDYLQSMPEVDEHRIGCGGLSLGGEMAMWLGAMDERIAATVSAGFLTTMDQMEQNHCMCWKFEGLRELVDFTDIYSLIAPRPLQCQNGLLEPPTQFYVPLARKAMEAPLRQIVENAGGEPSVVVNDVRSKEGNFGFNAATEQYGDMIEMGILDPAKVTRTALQAAASIAALMITTECMVSDIEETPAPAMPDMGGMGGMGGMM